MADFEKMMIDVLISIFINAITTLADRFDSKKEKKLEDIKEKLRGNNFIQIAITESIKTAHVSTKEVDLLKKLVSDDIFSKELADLISNQSQENDFIINIISKVKEHGKFKEYQFLTLEPFIKNFAQEFYKKILTNPQLSPGLIIKKVEEEHEKTRKSVKESSDEIKDGMIEIKNEIIKEIKESQEYLGSLALRTQTSDTITCNYDNYSTASAQINKSVEMPRVTQMLSGQLEKVLTNLNRHFKLRVAEVREIQKKRDFKRAIEIYQSLLKDVNENIDKDTVLSIYIDCALCAVNLNETELAKTLLSEADNINNNDKRVLALWGLYYYESNDKAAAQLYVDKSLALDKYYHLALTLKTGIELESGTDGRKILQQYFLDRAGNVKPDFKEEHMAVIYRTIGQCYLKGNEFNKAIEYFEKSLSLDLFDDSTFSLMGNAYMGKATGENKHIIRFHENLTLEKKELVKRAISYFSKALELATQYRNIKYHIPTRTNLSTCYMLLGEYDKAYDIPEISNNSMYEYEALLKSRAAAAYYKGSFKESAELLSKVSNVTLLDIRNRVLSLLYSNNEIDALEVIENSLNNKSFNTEDLSAIRYLKFEILISSRDQKNAEEELKILENSMLPEWQKEKAHGDYYDLTNEHNKADLHYKKALDHPDTTSPAKIFIADYYFRKKDYTTSFHICSSIHLEEIKSGLDLFKRLLQMSIISSFQISKYNECRIYIDCGKQQGIKDSYLYEISASIYWREDELEKAKDELLFLLGKENAGKKLTIYNNLILLFSMTGDFKSAQEHFLEAKKIPEFYEDSNLVINCINALILIGNRIEAKIVYEKAIEEKFEQKDDVIHKFAPAFYLRENNADLLAKYIVEFNKKHGDTEWLWKKDINKDEEELKTIFKDALRQSKEIKQGYLKHPIPLAFLPKLFRTREVAHLWRFNKEYNFPIFLESGNPKALESEIKTITNMKSVLIDYTTLLALQIAGTEFLWILENTFNEIFIYRPMYVQILNELILEEHAELREIIKFVSSSKKVKFIKGITNKTLIISDKNLHALIPEDYYGLFQIAKEKDICLLLGEIRLRSIAKSLEIGSFGVRALFEFTKYKNIIDNQDLSKAVTNMVDKECRFVSFNSTMLEWLFHNNTFENIKRIFNKLSRHIFIPGSEIESFINVYYGFIQKIIATTLNNQLIKYFIEKTIQDIKELTSNALIFNDFPSLNEDGFFSDVKKINTFSFRYIYLLLVVIYSSKIEEKLKTEYVTLIKEEANLAYWYKLNIQNKNVIKFIFEEAKRKAQEFTQNT